MNTHIIKTPLY